MGTIEHTGLNCTYDRTQFVAFAHYYIPSDENYIETSFQPILQVTPPAFSNLAEAFKRNFAAVASTACMPFRIASAHPSHWLYHQFLMAEEIRALKSQYDDQSEPQPQPKPRDIPTKRH